MYILHAPPTTAIYTLSLHDALPIFSALQGTEWLDGGDAERRQQTEEQSHAECQRQCESQNAPVGGKNQTHRRSEEHTSELQSRFDLVCRLLLEKKKLRT